MIDQPVYTDPTFAYRIVHYFRPQFRRGHTFLDPCRGIGAFYDCLPARRDWCELREGRDFLRYDRNVDWILTNPPWGRSYTAFADQAFSLADNVVFLIMLTVALCTTRRVASPEIFAHGLREVILCDWDQARFRYFDGRLKTPEGYQLAVMHWQRHWQGDTRWERW